VTTYDVSTFVEALSGNVICERSMYGNNRTWATDSIGVSEPQQKWYLAEGSTDGGMETFVLVQNPGESDAVVDIKLQTDTGEKAPSELQGITIPARSRRTYKVNNYVTTYDVSTAVTGDKPLVVERSLFINQ